VLGELVEPGDELAVGELVELMAELLLQVPTKLVPLAA